MAQTRQRVFIVAFRADLDVEWKWPRETHSEDKLLWAQHRGTYWAEHGIVPPQQPGKRITEARIGRWEPEGGKDGRRVWSAPIGIGRGEEPTPSGRFYARERLLPPKRGTIYGIFAFGTSATSPTLTTGPAEG